MARTSSKTTVKQLEAKVDKLTTMVEQLIHNLTIVDKVAAGAIRLHKNRDINEVRKEILKQIADKDPLMQSVLLSSLSDEDFAEALEKLKEQEKEKQ
jgi:hypothetical protein